MKFSDIPQFNNGSWQYNFDLQSLVEWITDEREKENLQLNPDFQRGHVWTQAQQIAFLEYFLQGGKSGTRLYFNKPDWHNNVEKGSYNDFVCVDGLQRITAITRFINNEIPIFGTFFRGFKDRPRMTHTIKINVNNLKSKKEVLQWYIDMNAGGTPHTSEEIDRVKKMIEEPG